jgi:hypothetical protein
LPEPRMTNPRGRVRARGVRKSVASDFVPRPPTQEDGVAARVRRECAAQGAPEKVQDPAIIARVVTLAWSGRAKAPRSNRGLTARARTRSGQRA